MEQIVLLDLLKHIPFIHALAHNSHVHKAVHNPLAQFVDAILRGISQVFFQNNPLTGVCFLVGIFVNSWVGGLYMLLATAVATLSAVALGAPRTQIEKGLYGFNAALTGLALAFYLKHDSIFPLYVIIASIFVTVVTAFLDDALKGVETPSLTGAFVLTGWIFLAAASHYGRLVGAPALVVAHLPAQASVGAQALTPADAWYGLFNGIAQVFFQKYFWTGVAILVGLVINSPISCAMAILGSLTGLGVAWAAGGAASTVRGGFFGFNSVLTAVALGGVFYLASARSILYAFIAAIVTAIAFGTLSTILAPVGLPVLTGAFVFITWIFLIPKKSLSHLQPVKPEDVTSPEKELKVALQAAHGGGDD